jgi:hypothetical protein
MVGTGSRFVAFKAIKKTGPSRSVHLKFVSSMLMVLPLIISVTFSRPVRNVPLFRIASHMLSCAIEGQTWMTLGVFGLVEFKPRVGQMVDYPLSVHAQFI